MPGLLGPGLWLPGRRLATITRGRNEIVVEGYPVSTVYASPAYHGVSTTESVATDGLPGEA